MPRNLPSNVRRPRGLPPRESSDSESPRTRPDPSRCSLRIRLQLRNSCKTLRGKRPARWVSRRSSLGFAPPPQACPSTPSSPLPNRRADWNREKIHAGCKESDIFCFLHRRNSAGGRSVPACPVSRRADLARSRPHARAHLTDFLLARMPTCSKSERATPVLPASDSSYSRFPQVRLHLRPTIISVMLRMVLYFSSVDVFPLHRHKTVTLLMQKSSNLPRLSPALSGISALWGNNRHGIRSFKRNREVRFSADNPFGLPEGAKSNGRLPHLRMATGDDVWTFQSDAFGQPVPSILQSARIVQIVARVVRQYLLRVACGIRVMRLGSLVEVLLIARELEQKRNGSRAPDEMDRVELADR